jgi:hypothetical protein
MRGHLHIKYFQSTRLRDQRLESRLFGGLIEAADNYAPRMQVRVQYSLKCWSRLTVNFTHVPCVGIFPAGSLVVAA